MSTAQPAREPFFSAPFRAGVRDAIGVPAAVLAAGMIGFGAFALEHGLSLGLALACTVGIWALPGQIVLLEMHAGGAPGLLTVLAVALTSARFLPMAMTLMPVVRHPRYSRACIYLGAQVIAMTGWAWAMRACRDMPQGDRYPYFAGFGAACWVAGIVATAVGYALAGSFSETVRLGFVFLAPVYFFVILIGDARTTLAVCALGCGALAGPIMHALSPQWSVLLAGLAGGTVAYALQRACRRHGSQKR